MAFHIDIKPIRITPVKIKKLKKELELEQDIVNRKIRRGSNNNNNDNTTIKKPKFQRD